MPQASSPIGRMPCSNGRKSSSARGYLLGALNEGIQKRRERRSRGLIVTLWVFVKGISRNIKLLEVGATAAVVLYRGTSPLKISE